MFLENRFQRWTVVAVVTAALCALTALSWMTWRYNRELLARTRLEERGISVGSMLYRGPDFGGAALQGWGVFVRAGSVSIDGRSVSAEDIRELHALTHLTHVFLTDCSVTEGAWEEIARLKNVCKIFLLEVEMSDQAMKTLASMPKLTRVELTYCNITSQSVCQLRSLPKLDALILTEPSVDDAVLECVADMPSLTVVDLHETNVSREGVARLRARRPSLAIEW